ERGQHRDELAQRNVRLAAFKLVDETSAGAGKTRERGLGQTVAAPCRANGRADRGDVGRRRFVSRSGRFGYHMTISV
ncbi:MAG TPA: hypothetical protein VFL30_06415, partial [Rhodanobacteraceae bacterium]|nr:hypothetical protein [Rhodanobacteraceae bacterium]